jgi:hypothetical protein
MGNVHPPHPENIRALARDIHACKYISLSVEEADEVASANALGTKLMARIDRELSTLGTKYPINRGHRPCGFQAI